MLIDRIITITKDPISVRILDCKLLKCIIWFEFGFIQIMAIHKIYLRLFDVV